MSGYIKLFSGTSILVNRLAYILDEIGIASIVKDNQESGRLAGFGTLGQSVDLLINEGVGRIPVVDDDGYFLGMVTRTDVLRQHKLYDEE